MKTIALPPHKHPANPAEFIHISLYGGRMHSAMVCIVKETLIYSAIPAAQGCAAIFDGHKPLKMKESEKHIFRFPCAENSRMELFSVSSKKSSHAVAATAPIAVFRLR